MYSERLLQHFQHPRNVGVLPAPALSVEAQNPACGDILRLSARISEGRVAEAAFQVRGCTASIACGSALTEWLTGRTIAGLKEMKASAIAASVEAAVGGLSSESKHAAVLAADGVRLLLLKAGL